MNTIWWKGPIVGFDALIRRRLRRGSCTMILEVGSGDIPKCIA